MADDNPIDPLLRVLIIARRKGATVRTLARLCRCSKSSMGRLIQELDALPDDVLSHLGQSVSQTPAETLVSRHVPFGTAPP